MLTTLGQNDHNVFPLDDIWQGILAEAKPLKRLDPAITGCRFLYSARETLVDNNGLMLSGISPGDEANMQDRCYNDDDVNAYLSEVWSGSRYQSEMVLFMVRLFGALGTRESDLYDRFNTTLTANLTPFRSSRFSNLSPDAQSASVAFGRRLWARVLPHTGVRAIICCGEVAYEGFKAIRSSNEKLKDLILVHITHASSNHWDGGKALAHALAVLTSNNFSFR